MKTGTVLDCARNEQEKQIIEETLALLAESQSLETAHDSDEEFARLNYVNRKLDELVPQYASITDPNRG